MTQTLTTPESIISEALDEMRHKAGETLYWSFDSSYNDLEEADEDAFNECVVSVSVTYKGKTYTR